jgi:O-antigen biosynthesis protein
VEVIFERATFAGFCAEGARLYDAVLVSCPHHFKRTYFSIKDFFPNAGFIYDAEALFSNREDSKAKSKGQRLRPKQVEGAANAEISLLSLADAALSGVPWDSKRDCLAAGLLGYRVDRVQGCSCTLPRSPRKKPPQIPRSVGG